MERTVIQVDFPMPAQPQVTRVAAYARVSSGKDAMLHSLSAQVSYYSNLIQRHKGWQFAGVYTDEAKTGTKDSRENFNRLINDCRAGKIDRVITKSISRFARNTVTLLSTVRELKSLGIDVYFEEQNIHSMSSDGELMLTILASYAQEESLSASENQKWRYQKIFEQGIMPLCGKRLYGYTRTDDFGFEIVPDEAEVIKEIFELFLSGWGIQRIRNELNARGIKTEVGTAWGEKKIRYMLSNERYCGDLLLQKYFVKDHLSKEKVKNNGERPKYFVENDHEPIITKETFNAVQAEFERRVKKHHKDKPLHSYPFTGIVRCGVCGNRYKRKVTKSVVMWVCQIYSRFGKASCASKQIPEATLIKEATAALDLESFDEAVFKAKIDHIIADNGNKLTFHFKDGTVKERIWKDRSRSESWTAEMKEVARQRAIEQRRKK